MDIFKKNSEESQIQIIINEINKYKTLIDNINRFHNNLLISTNKLSKENFLETLKKTLEFYSKIKIKILNNSKMRLNQIKNINNYLEQYIFFLKNNYENTNIENHLDNKNNNSDAEYFKNTLNLINNEYKILLINKILVLIDLLLLKQIYLKIKISENKEENLKIINLLYNSKLIKTKKIKSLIQQENKTFLKYKNNEIKKTQLLKIMNKFFK